jgi:transcriptional regulator with XRE-family HTH domain
MHPANGQFGWLGDGENGMSRHEQPVKPGPLHSFATDLRALRAATGLTYRALARKAGFSSSTLSAAASGVALPTLDVTLAYAGACGGDMPAWEQRWHALATALPEPAPTDAVTSPNNNNDNPDAVTSAPSEQVESELGVETDAMDTPEPSADTPAPALAARSQSALSTETVVIPSPRPSGRGRARARWLLAAALPVVALVVVLGLPRSPFSPTQSLSTPPAGLATPSRSVPRSSSATGGHGDPTSVPGSALGVAVPSESPAPVGVGSHGPGPTGTGGPGVSAPRPGPGGGQNPVPQQQAVATASSGPSCVSGNATPMQVAGSWQALAGTAAAGCADALTHKQTNDANTADWILTPGVGRICTFRAYIPNSGVITSTNATYKGWDTAPGRHDPVDRLGQVRTNQQANRGGWMLIGSFGPTQTGTIDLQLYDNESDKTLEVADTVTATCT